MTLDDDNCVTSIEEDGNAVLRNHRVTVMTQMHNKKQVQEAARSHSVP
jgi:hypothetical protein